MLMDVREEFEAKKHIGHNDVIAFWKRSECEEMRPLWPLIQHVLCVPASSASAERLFSSLKFLNDDGGNTNLSTLENLAIIREVTRDVTYSFEGLVEMIDANEKKEPVAAKQ